MNEHLPECEMSTSQCAGRASGEGHRGAMFCLHCHRRCICSALRACEQRVLDEGADDLTITRGVNYAHGYADGYAKGRKDAYAAGIDAAREAVEALRGCLGADDNGDGTVWVEKADALAVIDELKEKQ